MMWEGFMTDTHQVPSLGELAWGLVGFDFLTFSLN